ncbi:MAG: hypothetical protein ACJAU6_001274 [Alphaproteobacteria bacterium]|jgi:hypothetical protein
MSEYDFFIRHLRFIAARTEKTEPDVSAMVDELNRIADAIEQTGRFIIPAERLKIAGRGLAGLAGFLQERILPEAIAAGNSAGEGQIRWVIDTSMNLMSVLLARAESEAAQDATMVLPPPPE